MKTEPSFIGSVGAVAGSTVNVLLAQSVASGIAIVDGSAYRIGQVGSFIRIPVGYQDLYGIVTDIGAGAAPENISGSLLENSRWMKIQLIGEAIGMTFERGISQYPNVNDPVHLVTEKDLRRIYGATGNGQITVGRLSSAESIQVRMDLDKLVTRHSAVLGSTGSGKSTTVTSLLRSIVMPTAGELQYNGARILMLDIHGEYPSALSDVSEIYRINAQPGEHELSIPYWALEPNDLINFLTGGISDDKAPHFYDKIVELKTNALKHGNHTGIAASSMTIDSPVPYSLKRLWFELIEPELRTLEGKDRDVPAVIESGDLETLTPPKYKPHAMGAVGPFLNTAAPGLKRQLGIFRSKLFDRQYDFLLHPGDWEPNADGATKKDLADILQNWLGHSKPITILDLSGVPSDVLNRLIGAILKVIYEALFWSRDKSEGGRERPLLLVMEEAHRYLAPETNSSARETVQRIVKEGRKYGIGAMVISQRPSEVDETILSQCGTFVAMRLSNPADRAKIKGTLPDSLASLMEMLPILRTGEAIITGEAVRLPIRCRINLPEPQHRPNSDDPKVHDKWVLKRFLAGLRETYLRIASSWRAQSPRTADKRIPRVPVDDGPANPEGKNE